MKSHSPQNDEIILNPDPNKGSIPPNEPDKIRRILTYVSVGLALIGIVAVIYTGNIEVLIGASITAYPLKKVIDYYFRK